MKYYKWDNYKEFDWQNMNKEYYGNEKGKKWLQNYWKYGTLKRNKK